MASVVFVPKTKRLPGSTHLLGVRRRNRSTCALLLTAGFAAAAMLGASPRGARAEDCSEFSDETRCPKAAAFETARGLALGTGLRASSVSTSALAYSPGALSLGNLYHIEANLDYLAALNTVALGAAAVDSSTSKVGAGIALRGFLSGDEGYSTDAGYDYDGLDGHVGIALSLSDKFSIGVGARYIDLASERDDPDAPERELAQGFTMDAGMRIMPVNGLQLDFAALNFIDLDSAFVPVTLATGVAISAAEALSIGADVLLDMSTFDDPQVTVGGGIEYLGGNAVPIRAGYSFDVVRELHAVSAGIGYTDQRVGVDVGLRQEVSGGDDTRVMASVRYHVN